MHANIQPVSIWQGKAQQSGVVLDALVILFPNVGARVEWKLCNSSMQPIAQGLEEMRGADFDAWGSDDGHVYRWLAERLGLTITELVEPPPPAPPAPASDPGPGDLGFVEGAAG